MDLCVDSDRSRHIEHTTWISKRDPGRTLKETCVVFSCSVMLSIAGDG